MKYGYFYLKLYEWQRYWIEMNLTTIILKNYFEVIYSIYYFPSL